MRRTILVALGTGAVITSAVAAIGFGSGFNSGEALEAGQYRAALAQIAQERREEQERCAALNGHAREACRVSAEANEAARAAELEAGYRRTHAAARAAQRARIDARYTVARAKCAPLGGFARDQCLVEAHALRGRALLEAQVPYEGNRAS